MQYEPEVGDVVGCKSSPTIKGRIVFISDQQVVLEHEPPVGYKDKALSLLSKNNIIPPPPKMIYQEYILFCNPKPKQLTKPCTFHYSNLDLALHVSRDMVSYSCEILCLTKFSDDTWKIEKVK